MAQRHQYFGIENLGLNASQKQTVVENIQALGRDDSAPNPSRRLHKRVRLDNDAMIFEAVFEDGDLTIANIKQWLATIFSVATGSISHVVTTPAAGTVVTFTYNSIQRLRMVVFGGPSATREQSRVAAAAYIAANIAQWES